MTEIDKTTVEDTAESAGCAAAAEDEVAADAGAESADGAVSEDAQAEQGKFAAAFGKGKAFMTRHGNIWQIVKFTLISLIAFIAEFASMYALQYGLESTLGDKAFGVGTIFYYAPGRDGAFGTAGFIAMLVSKCIAEVISFTVNRKKTFNANNNVAFSVTMYVITVVTLVVFTTWLAGVLGDAMGPVIGADIGNTISKMVGSIISFVVIFLMDKFVIMRKVKGKDDAEEKGAAETAETADDGEGAESLVADAAAEVEIDSAADRE